METVELTFVEEWKPWTRRHFEIKRLVEAKGFVLFKCWFTWDWHYGYYDGLNPPEEIPDYFHGEWTVQVEEKTGRPHEFKAPNMSALREQIAGTP